MDRIQTQDATPDKTIEPRRHEEMREAHVNTRVMPAWNCPSCGQLLDAITGVADSHDGTIPTVGKITVCAYCGTALIIGRDRYLLAERQNWDRVDPELRGVMEKLIRQKLGHGVVCLL
jgi:hypothetical protein